MQARERDVAGTQATSASLFRSVATTLAGKSLAIVGASERARWPSEIFRNLREFGYPNTDLCRLAPGSVACIFQSGGLLQFWMKAAAERGLRYSYCITSGNEPDLGLADYLNFVIDDPHTRQIVLFVEGIRRPQAFM